ncbi:type II toxin-antitoxin system HipA family toxin [Polynucleobacter brandtiae]|uniref:Serine/threonine-protein kinase HipA n=1 Tax=Polynucleobacter brandtiae TaxID=1938816 RepID=A0A2M8VR57_9BURK|nr:type II toxin-antitoxin system HipA family toxin [Polynucleobacter brandtiae]PJI79952.1 serine/threonine-protein kinase HipA [Polynucleobacter brandtiae]
MKKLEVIFTGWGQHWTLGTLADDGQQILFEYSSQAIERGDEFSPRFLKLQASALGDFPAHQHHLPGFIADALPDGWGMYLMDRYFTKQGIHRHQISPLDRLALIGSRAMGALQFSPSAEPQSTPTAWAMLDLAKEAEQAIAGHQSEALTQLILLGGSPHGARPKALVHYEESTENISTLNNAAGKPWLIKFQARHEHKEVCAIEDVYAQVARYCGLDIPKTQYFDLDAQLAGFGIERFDRSGTSRVPIHTLAGLMHVDFRIPTLGYDSLLKATRLITGSQRELEKAFERCVFNVVMNNRDDHAKNFSFRMSANFQWQLAPAYDLTFNEGPMGEHQMDIHGEGRHPSRLDLLKLAQSNGLTIATANHLIDKINEGASRFRELALNHAIRQDTVTLILHKIEKNQERMHH